MMYKMKVIFLTLFLLEEISSVADKAAYYIRNVQDGLCITGGPLIDEISTSLFQSGIIVSANCSESLNQQWIFRIKETKNQVPKYAVVTQNSVDLNKMLNAQISGEFIHYFPHLMEIPIFNDTQNETKYNFLYDTNSGKCYESMGDNHVVLSTECETNNALQSQLWKFTIVNQPVAAGMNCTSFWSCNP